MPMLSTFGGGSARGFKSDKQLLEFIDIYSYTGSSQSFNIPAGVNVVEEQKETQTLKVVLEDIP